MDKYHEKNFVYVPNDPNVETFVYCLYLKEESMKIYYDKREMSLKYRRHITDIGRECQKFLYFAPDSINWSSIYNRFKQPPNESSRTNVDTRIGYTFGNKFLVKAYFTFGQRTVPPGKYHVYQTMDVPLLFYLMPRDRDLHVEEGHFPFSNLNQYDRRILLPNGCYRIPSGVVYVIFALQKTYFSFDVIEHDLFEASLKLDEKLKFDDPVMNPVRKLPSDFYDEAPVPTPYIKHEDRDDFERYFDHVLPEEPERSLPESPEMFESPEIPEIPQPHPPELPENDVAQPPQQQIMLYMIPQTPSVYEKNVVVACPEFIDTFQKLNRKEYGDPKLNFVTYSSGEDVQTEPLNFKTEPLMELDDLLDTCDDLDSSMIDDVINDICCSSPFVTA